MENIQKYFPGCTLNTLQIREVIKNVLKIDKHTHFFCHSCFCYLGGKYVEFDKGICNRCFQCYCTECFQKICNKKQTRIDSKKCPQCIELRKIGSQIGEENEVEETRTLIPGMKISKTTGINSI